MSGPLQASSLLDPTVLADPYGFYDDLRRRAPVWRVPGTEIHVVSSYEFVVEATTRVEDFSSNMHALLYRDDDGTPARLSFGNAGVQTLATADPPDHGIHRSAVFPELVAKRMAELEADIEQAAAVCVDEMLQRGHAEAMADIANVVPFDVISRLIGFRDADPDRLKLAAFESTELLGSTVSLTQLHHLIGQIGGIESWIGDQIADARRSPGDDILGAVARAVTDGTFGTHEGCVTLHTLLSAGGESTTSLLGNAVRLLAEDPTLQDRLRADPGLVPAFVEEALRLESPFRYLLRSTHHPTSLGGVEIPADATLLLLWAAANRDPAHYEAADRVDLGRRVLRNHLAFGRGIHHCVGAPLARLEARIVLTALLDRTSSFRLDPADPPSWTNSLLVRRHERLPILLGAR